MGFLWFGKKEKSKPAPDGLVRLDNYCGKYEPVQTIIKMYDGDHPIQQTVNAFLDSEVHGYNRERIKKLIKIYLDLEKKGERFNYADIELLEGPVGGAKSAKSGAKAARGTRAAEPEEDELPEIDFDEPLPEYVDDSVKMNREENALLTRCDLVDIKVTRDEVLTRIRYLLPEIKIYNANGKNISKAGLKKEVFRWISSPTFLNDRRMRNKALDFRVFIKAYKARFANLPNWKQMAFSN